MSRINKLKLANKILGSVGFELNRIDYFQRALNQEIVSDSDFFFVQIGANDGVKFDGLFEFVTKHGCSGVAVEPLSIYYEKLKSNYANFPAVKPVKCAIHETERSVEIHYVDQESATDLPEWSEGIGSLNPNHFSKLGIPKESMVTETVDACSLMSLLDNNSITKINLLQIDVEGYDWEVIKMIDFTKIMPKIIKFEHAALSKDIQNKSRKYLKKIGYVVRYDSEDTIAIKK